MTASPLLVLERALEVHHHLDAAGIPHALGGALCLAYHVEEARATRDLDLNVMADPQHPESLFRVLPPGVPWGSSDAAAVRESGQVRLQWPHPDGQAPIPLDLFFPQHQFHDVVMTRTELVAMLDETIPILSATDLMVFKMLFDRRKDWADIEELVRFGKADVAEARSWLTEIVGPTDLRQATLDSLLAELSG
jgi:hypothetical protein